MLGKGRKEGYSSDAGHEVLHSGLPSDGIHKKGLPPAAVPAPQNQPLLLTPASLQLAQLQAQLTLHRLKLAQGGTAAANILNQVLSNVAMSQPLFNPLRTSSMLGAQAALPAAVLGFPSSGAALGGLASGGFNQSSANVRHHNGGAPQTGQPAGEFPPKSGLAYHADPERRPQYEAPAAKDALFTAANPSQHLSHVGFKPEFYGQDYSGPQTGFRAGEQNAHLYASLGPAETWKDPGQSGPMDLGPDAASVWKAAGPPARPRADLYDPEEPTSDLKFHPKSGAPSFGAVGRPGFGGYPPAHGAEETRTLLPHQVNDFHAVVPAQLPHQCSICDKKVYNLKDWDQHVKGKLHLQNRLLFSSDSSAVSPAGATHFTVGRTSDVSHCSGGTGSMIHSAAGQDASSGASAAYLPAAAMSTYPLSNPGFTAHPPESKAFPPRKATAGRVVHICNLPEGSCTENDVINLGLPFGKVTKYILMRSTHQAFLELSYVEAAQAMVQYYQLTPAMIHNQKLLIRMSKRYKELQLKKPGKDVQSIIQDIASQRDREEMQELEHYAPERARSRSPHSHSPTFTSCGSVHSPQGAPPRERCNGTGPGRGPWDRCVHVRRAEEEKERGDAWRNGGCADDDRLNGRASERRKPYCGGDEGMRGARDWYPRSGPQDYSPYRRMEEPPYRPSYLRHDGKARRKDGGDHHSSRALLPEEKSSPCRARGRRPGRRSSPSEKHEPERTDRPSREKSSSPQKNQKIREGMDPPEPKLTEKEQESAENTDEECWFPKNMEELVTVDEVGGEEDSIIEPDLPELEEMTLEERPVPETSLAPTPSADVQERDGGEPCAQGLDQTHAPETLPETLPGLPPEAAGAGDTAAPEPELSGSPGEELKAALEETCLPDEGAQGSQGSQEETAAQNPKAPEDVPTPGAEPDPEPVANGTPHKELAITADIEAQTSSSEQDKAVSELSIPLGVEFVVPSSGFYCKLCGLFYTSEETAKSAHCRSTVHYMNLQKYLSQLAQQSLMMELSKPAVTH